MEEELFEGIGEIELGNDYMDSGEGTELLDIPSDGSNPNPEEDQEDDKQEDQKEPTQTKQKDDGKVPKEIQDLIDTNNIEKESDEEGGEEEGKSDSEKETKDSDKEAPDSPDDDNSDDSSPSASVDPYIAFGNTLKEGGSFVTFDEEEFKKLAKEKKDPEAAFVEMQKKELEKAKEDYINGLSDEDRELYEAKQSGANLNEVGSIDKTMKSYNQITDEFLDDENNIETAKSITKEYLRLKGFEEDEIKENIELYEENGSLSKWAKKARSSIVDTLKDQKQTLIDNQKKEKERELQTIEEKKQNLKKTINGFDEIVPGVKINDNIKQEVFKDMTTPVAEDENGNPMDAFAYQRSKNPEVVDAAIYYYNRLGLFNIDENGNFKPDFSKVKNAADTKASKRLDKVLNSNNNESFKPRDRKKPQEKEESLFDGI